MKCMEGKFFYLGVSTYEIAMHRVVVHLKSRLSIILMRVCFFLCV